MEAKTTGSLRRRSNSLATPASNRFAVTVRDRVVEAYQEILRMPV